MDEGSQGCRHCLLHIAIKMVRNDAAYKKEAENEVKILRHLLTEDLGGNGNVVHMKASFVFR